MHDNRRGWQDGWVIPRWTFSAAALADIKAAEESQRLRRTRRRDSPQSAKAAGEEGLLQLFAKIIGEYIDKAVIQLDERLRRCNPWLPMCRCTSVSQPNRGVLPRRLKSSRWKTRLQFCKLKWCGANRLTRTQSKAQSAAAERKYAEALQRPPSFIAGGGDGDIQPPALKNFIPCNWWLRLGCLEGAPSLSAPRASTSCRQRLQQCKPASMRPSSSWIFRTRRSGRRAWSFATGLHPAAILLTWAVAAWLQD